MLAFLAKNFPQGLLSSPKPSLDALLTEADRALKTLAAKPIAQRNNPARSQAAGTELSSEEKERVIGLMRVNHVGEICAQALYQAQAMTASSPERRALFEEAAREEADHLAWCQERLDELGARPSLLNPLWYTGAFALGFVAGQLGDKVSLGFMAETEKQVERHLNDHLARLPAGDQASRAILEQMKQDEIEHGQTALNEGGQALPLPVKVAMTAMSKIMTNLAQKI